MTPHHIEEEILKEFEEQFSDKQFPANSAYAESVYFTGYLVKDVAKDFLRSALSTYRARLLEEIENGVEARIIEFYPIDTAEKRKKLAMHISNLLK